MQIATTHCSPTPGPGTAPWYALIWAQIAIGMLSRFLEVVSQCLIVIVDCFIISWDYLFKFALIETDGIFIEINTNQWGFYIVNRYFIIDRLREC